MCKYQIAMYALALLPDHVHIVFGRQDRFAEEMIGFCKRSAARALRKAGLHPLAAHVLPNDRLPTPRAEDGWKVYLHDADEIARSVRYVKNNPSEAGLPPQHWDFLTTPA